MVERFARKKQRAPRGYSDDDARSCDGVKGPDFSALIITHYQRLLNYLKPDVVHIISDGKIVSTGDEKLALEVEKKGYQWLVAE